MHAPLASGATGVTSPWDEVMNRVWMAFDRQWVMCTAMWAITVEVDSACRRYKR